MLEGSLGQTTFEATVTPSANEVWSISYDGAAWTESTSNGDAAPDVGMGTWWQGAPSSPQASSPSDVDQELLERLRMLGYVR